MSRSLNHSSALIEKPEDLTPKKECGQSAAEELNNGKKSRIDSENVPSLNKIINLGIPHVGELIFERIDTPELLSCMEDRKLGKNWLKMS